MSCRGASGTREKESSSSDLVLSAFRQRRLAAPAGKALLVELEAAARHLLGGVRSFAALFALGRRLHVLETDMRSNQKRRL